MLWIGTHGGGLNRFDRRKGTFTHYRNQPNYPRSLSSNNVYAILEDSLGIMWIGTWDGGLNKFNRKTETFTRFKSREDDPQSLSFPNVQLVYEDSGGTLWIGTEGGLNKFNRKTETFTRYTWRSDTPHCNPTAGNERCPGRNLRGHYEPSSHTSRRASQDGPQTGHPTNPRSIFRTVPLFCWRTFSQ